MSQADSDEWKVVRTSASSSEGKADGSPPPEILSLASREHDSPSSDKVSCYIVTWLLHAYPTSS